MKTPKYNNPRSLYSDDVMDEMASGATAIEWETIYLMNVKEVHRISCQLFTFYSPKKLDPNSKAFEKLKNAKKFDPKRSSVLEVLNEQLKKTPDVDSMKIPENENDTGRKI